MKSSRPHSCNVVQVGADSRQLWQFATGNGEVALTAEQRLASAHPLPVRLVAKNWRSLWQQKLNIAWLPAEQVFLRVVHLPACVPEELRSMVELQLEKLSPLPVNQIVWSFETLPGPADKLQTVIVVIAERSVVEEFLGRLEGGGYLADRLELPWLHQLLVTRIDGDGAWVYLQTTEAKTLCLTAWWFGGTLQQLNLFRLPLGAAGAAELTGQLAGIAWAGELEGWLTGSPRWHLVAAPETANVWEPELRRWTGESVQILRPLSTPELAALSARRTARVEAQANLLPGEFALRYRQQFIDRLWMRGLGALAVVYVLGVVVYFAALEVLKVQRTRVEKQVAALSGAYTNALQLRERHRVLQEQVNLKYAALDCWKVAAELLPAELTLASFNFARGSRLTLRGTAPADESAKVTEYNTAMGAAILDGRKLFRRVNPATIENRQGMNEASWFFDCELLQTGIE